MIFSKLQCERSSLSGLIASIEAVKGNANKISQKHLTEAAEVIRGAGIGTLGAGVSKIAILDDFSTIFGQNHTEFVVLKLF